MIYPVNLVEPEIENRLQQMFEA
jgi:hypothetical protein